MKIDSSSRITGSKKQQGFAAQGIVVLVVVVVLVVGGGYYVLSRQNTIDEPNIVTSQSSESTEPNGTPENAVNAVNEQLTTELTSELSALEDEDKDSDIDPSAIDDLEGAINEANL